jgi:hypothetical protein
VFRVAADGYRGVVQYDANTAVRCRMARELVVGTEGWPLPTTCKSPSRHSGEWRDGVFSCAFLLAAGRL